MRPAGVIRRALRDAAASMGDSGGTWREMAARACVGYAAARQTVRDMHRAGELVQREQKRVPGVNRPMGVYVLAIDDDRQATAAIDSVMRSWVEFR